MTRLRTHPGEVLVKSSWRRWASAPMRWRWTLRVPATRITAIIRRWSPRASRRTPRFAARYIGTIPQFWQNLQLAHDLSLVEQQRGPAIARDVPAKGGLTAALAPHSPGVRSAAATAGAAAGLM